MAPESRYKFPSIETYINRWIGLVFYYRLLLVMLFLAGSIYATYQVWDSTTASQEDKYKNSALVFTAGSIIIGIFYSIINYEHNKIKFEHDKITSKGVLSFNTAFEWHKPNVVSHLKVTKEMYEKHKQLIDDNKSSEFYKILEADDSARAALVSILNYFECIAIGCEHNIMDSEFIKSYFKTLMVSYYTDYGFYINYRRDTMKDTTAWICFTDMAQKWKNEKN